MHGIYRLELYRGCLRDISLNNKQTDEQVKEVHLKDARNTLEYLKTAKNNTNKSEKDWEDFVKARIEHVNDFVKGLNEVKKDLEHFK